MTACVRSFPLRALFFAGLLATSSATALASGPATQSAKTASAKKTQLSQDYGKLPLSFEANAGQTDASVKFLSRGSGYSLYLRADEAVLALNNPAFGAGDVLNLQLSGASHSAYPTGEQQLPGTANYFLGNDPAKWHSSVPTYARVRYAGIYSGVDLVYYGNQRQLEYDFVVAPGADPSPIRMKFAGAREVTLSPDGNLVLTAANGAAILQKPLVYQVVEGKRQIVDGSFALADDQTVTFRLGDYDHAKELVIDPVLVYSTYLGGSGDDAGYAIAVDSIGDVYVTGGTTSIDFPLSAGAYQSTNNGAAGGYATVFVSKLNPAGTALVYSTYLGGSGGDYGNSIAVDGSGDAYITGGTGSTDFPVTKGVFQSVNNAAVNYGENAFVTKLNPAGTALLYSTFLGGSTNDDGASLAVDSSGDVYLNGASQSSDFPVTPGAFQTTNNGYANYYSVAFVSKLNPTGASLIYSTFLGGSGDDEPYGLAVDSSGDAYITGSTGSTDFPVTPGAFQSTNNGAANYDTVAFVTELNPAGTAEVYSTFLGGSGGDAAAGIAVDGSGNAYVAGTTSSTDFPITSGAFQSTNNDAANGLPNAFVTKLNPAGNAEIYSTFLGGTGGQVVLTGTLIRLAGDQSTGLLVDSSGDVYITGYTASTDFPVTAGAFQPANNASIVGGNYNGFVTELNPSGTALTYSTYFGGSGFVPGNGGNIHMTGDQANSLAQDNSGNVYVTGSSQSFDFPVTSGAYQTANNSVHNNAFLSKLDFSSTVTTTTPTVTVTPALSSITSNQQLAVTVAVSGAGGAATGSVTLASYGYSAPAATLSGGSATFQIPGGSLASAPIGYAQADALAARYIPDSASAPTYNSASGFNSVIGVAATVTVTPPSTTLTWPQAQQSQAVAINVVGGSGYPAPVGTVSLNTGNYTSATVALSGGNATITIPAGTLTTGFNVLTVNYSGDANYTADQGSNLITVGGVSVDVTPSATTITTTQALQVAVLVDAGNNPTATGDVTLQTTNYTSATVTLTNGAANFTIPAGTLPVGVNPLNVSYGDGNYAGAFGSASVTVTATPPGFSITGSALAVPPGTNTANTIVTVTPAGGFTGSVALAAAITAGPTGAVDPPTLSFGSTSPVTISGAGAATGILTVTTVGDVGSAIPHKFPWEAAAGDATLACLLLFTIPARRRGWKRLFGFLTFTALLVTGMSACGGGSKAGTTPGRYLVTVTGTSGSTTSSSTIIVTVQ